LVATFGAANVGEAKIPLGEVLRRRAFEFKDTVQVGPFADVKDAEATRARLVADGYTPILKK